MKTIHLDVDFKCHTSEGEGMIAVETEAFDGKCNTFIEGYRFVPNGAIWTREDGVVFHGEMIAPWKPYNEMEAAQAQYERDTADLQAAYQEGVNSAYD